MGGDAHSHGPPYRVPDHTIYKIKGIPELEAVEAALAERGLKDPWLRNEVWRYNKGFGTKLSRGMNLFFRGFAVGLALTVATVAYDKTIGGGNSHGHGEGHGDHH